MNLPDMIRLGLENLLRAKLRTVLTVLGVVVGIGALTSMVSFGTGMQKNITDAFRDSDLFTSLYVTAGDVGEITDPDDYLPLHNFVIVFRHWKCKRPVRTGWKSTRG